MTSLTFVKEAVAKNTTNTAFAIYMKQSITICFGLTVAIARSVGINLFLKCNILPRDTVIARYMLSSCVRHKPVV